ncbi:MAG: hypothetical protein K0S38_724 [Candidatus Paceibacter sp.]|jgi:hypothetical protein|nr:hypothetical protein [Candidatus Paceibacter sp.]
MKKIAWKKPVITGVVVLAVVIGVSYLSMDSACACKQSDAAVKAQVSAVRDEAEAYYETNKSYIGLCDQDKAHKLMIAIEKNSGNSNAECNASGKAYAIQGYLPEMKKYYCIDSEGTKTFNDTLIPGALFCN